MGSNVADKSIVVVDTPREGEQMIRRLRTFGFSNIMFPDPSMDFVSELTVSPPEVLIIDQYPWTQLTARLTGFTDMPTMHVIVLMPQAVDEYREEPIPGLSVSTLKRPFKAEELVNAILSVYGIDRSHGRELAQEAYALGMNRLTNGSYDRHIKAIRHALNSEPDLYYFFSPGSCYLNQGKYEAVLARFDSDLHEVGQIDNRTAPGGMSHEDYLAAIRHLKRIIERQKAGSDHYVQLGKSYLGVDMIPEADESFETAVRLEPENISNRKQIGIAYLEKQLYQKAEKALAAAIDRSPDNFSLYTHIAIALRKLGRYKEAIGIYRRAIKIDPGDEALYFNLARALYEANQPEKAIMALKKALSLDPNFTEARAMLSKYQAL